MNNIKDDTLRKELALMMKNMLATKAISIIIEHYIDNLPNECIMSLKHLVDRKK